MHIKYVVHVLLQNGEIDCWPMECPPTFCSHPKLVPGHCCPICEEELNQQPLNLPESNDIERLSWLGQEGQPLQRLRQKPCHGKNCLHLGKEYQSGQSWALIGSNNCTECNCRVLNLPH